MRVDSFVEPQVLELGANASGVRCNKVGNPVKGGPVADIAIRAACSAELHHFDPGNHVGR